MLGRTPGGFDREAPLIAAIETDPLLSRRRMIAEPWDIGPGGYQLGGFPPRWGEWNDRYRDDVRKFWRGDSFARAGLATRLSGSADIFPAPRRRPSASINFVASHDGMTLRDVVSFAGKHNAANGEDDRDGTNDNHSWNNGSEGATADPVIAAARDRDVRALLATLFVSRGAPMLTAGDEFGRSQRGNNNAYAQDNELTFLDWTAADRELIAFVERLARLRSDLAPLLPDRQADGLADPVSGVPDIGWLGADGEPLANADWQQPSSLLGMSLADPAKVSGRRCVVWFNAGRGGAVEVRLPPPTATDGWQVAFDSSGELAEGVRVTATLALPATISGRGNEPGCNWRSRRWPLPPKRRPGNRRSPRAGGRTATRLVVDQWRAHRRSDRHQDRPAGSHGIAGRDRWRRPREFGQAAARAADAATAILSGATRTRCRSPANPLCLPPPASGRSALRSRLPGALKRLSSGRSINCAGAAASTSSATASTRRS